MLEDLTAFKAFSPIAKDIQEGQVLPEATLEMWKLVKIEYSAGQYCQLGRMLLSFRAVHGWREFHKAYKSGGAEASFSIGESEDALLALRYFNKYAQQHGELKFSVLKVTELSPVEYMVQPQLGRDVVVTLKNDRLFLASEIASFFQAAGHDLVWRVFGDGEKPSDQVVMNTGHFLQFQNLLESDHYGMMTDCKQGEAGIILHFSISSRKSTDKFRVAIADMLEGLEVQEIRYGNCNLTFDQFVRVSKEGTKCLAEIFPAREVH